MRMSSGGAGGQSSTGKPFPPLGWYMVTWQQRQGGCCFCQRSFCRVKLLSEHAERGSPSTRRRKSEGPPSPSPDRRDPLTAPCTLPPCPGCSPGRKHRQCKWHIKTVNIINKYKYLTTAFFVFCRMGLSRDAHSGATTSPSVFFTFSTAGLGAGGLSSLLWGGGKSATGIFSRYGSELEGELCCWR